MNSGHTNRKAVKHQLMTNHKSKAQKRKKYSECFTKQKIMSCKPKNQAFTVTKSNPKTQHVVSSWI